MTNLLRAHIHTSSSPEDERESKSRASVLKLIHVPLYFPISLQRTSSSPSKCLWRGLLYLFCPMLGCPVRCPAYTLPSPVVGDTADVGGWIWRVVHHVRGDFTVSTSCLLPNQSNPIPITRPRRRLYDPKLLSMTSTARPRTRPRDSEEKLYQSVLDFCIAGLSNLTVSGHRRVTASGTSLTRRHCPWQPH
jgi:hypothetical protein